MTVDKSQQTYFTLSYVNPADDTALTDGDIPLPDAKTHQFFAFRAGLAVLGQSYTVRPFADPAAARVDLPLWITHADVQRAAAASASLMGVSLATGSDDLPDDAVLETFAPLHELWLRVTPDDARVPILARQSLVPVRWRLTDVAPDIYSLAGYIFSPPYNGWAIRPGVVKIRDPQRDPAAALIAPIADTVFSYQGRKVSVCVDAPNGTLADADYLQEDQPDAQWQSWFHGRPAVTGELGLCFHSRRKDLSGSIRLRVVLRTPAGERTVFHSSDTLTWLQGDGPCEESNTQCCAFDEAPDPPQLGEAAARALTLDSGLMDGTQRPAPRTGAGCCILQRTAAGWPWSMLVVAGVLRLVSRRRRNASVTSQ